MRRIVIPCLCLCCGVARAQITTDGPAKQNLTGSNITIPASLGKTSGSNLFHSFSRFNVNEPQTVIFTGSVNTKNILARVTGGGTTRIDGLLRSDITGASFYLINPAGVVIGPSGQIDVSGNLIVTTASFVRLGKDGRFDAIHPEKTVLSAASPSAFGFVNATPGKITLSGSDLSGAGLAVQNGKALSVIGGDVSIDRAGLRALGGRVNVVSARSAGSVRLDADSLTGLPTLDFAKMGDVLLSGDNAAMQANGGGALMIRAGNVTLDVNTTVSANNSTQPGRFVDVELTGALLLKAGATISASPSASENGASIRVRADGLKLDGLGALITTEAGAHTSAGAKGGSITIDVGELSILGGARVTSATFGAADAGNIDVTASRSIFIDTRGVQRLTGIDSETRIGSSGRGGSITLRSPLIEMVREAEITNTTRGPGRAGDITIHAGRLTLDGQSKQNPIASAQRNPTQIQARGGTTGSGRGDVRIFANTIELRDGGVISASTAGVGDGGSVFIEADDLNITGSDEAVFTGVFSRSARDTGSPQSGLGIGGSVDITLTRDLVMKSGGQISVVAEQTRAGDIIVRAGRAIELSDTRGIGPAPLAIDLPSDQVRHTRISAQADLGAGGNITLLAPDRVVLNNALVTARAFGDGAAISIDPDIVALNTAAIDGKSGGQPVDVTIVSDVFVRSIDSIIRTDSLSVPPDTDVAARVLSLPEGLFASRLELSELCVLRLDRAASSFVVGGRGAAAVEPGGFMPAR